MSLKVLGAIFVIGIDKLSNILGHLKIDQSKRAIIAVANIDMDATTRQLALNIINSIK